MSLRRAVRVCIGALADYEERERPEGNESVVVAEALLKLLRENERPTLPLSFPLSTSVKHG
jgi:hypothetical protein